MDIEVVLRVEDAADIDETDEAGLTSEAYSRLIEALADEGFGIVDGPTPRRG